MHQPHLSALWTPELKAFVESEQRQAYWAYIDANNSSETPEQLHARLNSHSVPIDEVLSETVLRRTEGLPGKDEFDYAGLDDDIRKFYGHYIGTPLPTAFESPVWFPILTNMSDVLRALYANPPDILSATLFSNDINAKIVREPSTRLPVVFFESNLFQYCYDFALIGGWALPKIPYSNIDEYLAALPQTHKMPIVATETFVNTLMSYTVYGTVTGTTSKPKDNIMFVMMLVRLMELFVMAHEHQHVIQGHSDESALNEFSADLSAMALVTTIARETTGSWCLGYWACDFVLIAFSFFYQTLSKMQYGDRVFWKDKSHPDPNIRRNYLWENVRTIYPRISEVETKALGNIKGMTESTFHQLWKMAHYVQALAFQQGVRPSKKWNNLINRTFTDQPI